MSHRSSLIVRNEPHTCAINRCNTLMDYDPPIEAVVPGVRGRVLGVLARADGELTMRSVAERAGISVNRAVSVLNQLIALGLRRSAALVRLDRDNEAANIVRRHLARKVIRLGLFWTRLSDYSAKTCLRAGSTAVTQR
jgi:hypothetical protein